MDPEDPHERSQHYAAWPFREVWISTSAGTRVSTNSFNVRRAPSALASCQPLLRSPLAGTSESRASGKCATAAHKHQYAECLIATYSVRAIVFKAASMRLRQVGPRARASSIAVSMLSGSRSRRAAIN